MHWAKAPQIQRFYVPTQLVAYLMWHDSSSFFSYRCTMRLDPESLYLRLGRLVETMPDLYGYGSITPDTNQWLGQAAALIEMAFGRSIDLIALKHSINELDSEGRHIHAQAIATTVHRALARAELAAPAAAQGAFIAVRESSSAAAAMARVMSAAKRSVLIVDPHADAKILTDFAVLPPEGVVVSILSDAGTRKPSLKPAAQAWINQYHGVRPLDVRVTQNLQDCLIVVDDAQLWTFTQSLNDFAARTSASIVKANRETAGLMIGTYREIWRGAASLMDLAIARSCDRRLSSPR